MHIMLEPYEFTLAAQVGLRRQLEARTRNLRERFGQEGPGWNDHIEGACGELAVAKALGVSSSRVGQIVRQMEVRNLVRRTGTRLNPMLAAEDIMDAPLTIAPSQYGFHSEFWKIHGDAVRALQHRDRWRCRWLLIDMLGKNENPRATVSGSEVLYRLGLTYARDGVWRITALGLQVARSLKRDRGQWY